MERNTSETRIKRQDSTRTYAAKAKTLDYRNARVTKYGDLNTAKGNRS